MNKNARWAIRAIQAAILATVLLTPAALATRTPKGYAVWLYLTGRAGDCGFFESLEAAELTMQQIAAAARIGKSTKLIAEDPAGFSLWDTPRGHFWMPNGNRSALEYNLAEQERAIYGGPDRGARTGDIVLDCGANVGVYTKKALASGAELVVAIEPSPENLECLRRNLAVEIASRKVIIVEKGVWDKDDVLTLHSNPHNSGAHSLHPLEGFDIKQVQVPLTTIDKLVTDLGLPRVDFIKMDIEGAEKQAILGARETIKEFKPRMAICTYHLPEDPTEIPKTVLSIVPSYAVKMQWLLASEKIFPEVAHFASAQ
ncbi:MAG TPA: FkbM family methyltransferase [Bryobacteraceae bacterium]|nr:FkbM family methyltransferase [Bryobacteraceae bacterium]HPQ16488.1 FkbM family methyltransferase [Bryobacteraceae bacterium]